MDHVNNWLKFIDSERATYFPVWPDLIYHMNTYH